MSFNVKVNCKAEGWRVEGSFVGYLASVGREGAKGGGREATEAFS